MRLMAAIKKEFLLLVRDRIGLGILFVMPMMLILVMTLIQDAAFSTLNEEGIPIVVVNNDKDSLGNRIVAGLHMAAVCDVSDSINGQPATEAAVIEAVKNGQFIIGIVIPEGATASIEANISQMVSASLGMEAEAGQSAAEIQLIIDPVATKSFITSVTSQLREFISSVKTRVMFESFNEQIADVVPEDMQVGEAAYSEQPMIEYRERYASEFSGTVTPNAVQHNVPAWTIFSMFFIVIPLVSSVMKEKKEGSVFRFHTIPASYFLQISAKLIVFVNVCLIQFVLMLSIGLVFLPMLGLPSLDLGSDYLGVFLVALATSFAATGYGVVVGTLASTQQQGAILGSLSILILSALGGIWVPAYVMPETMRAISELSPLHWALDGFYGLFLRGEGTMEVMPHILKLITFFAVCLGITVVLNRLKKRI